MAAKLPSRESPSLPVLIRPPRRPRTFFDAILANGFKSFSNQIRVYLGSLEHLGQELEEKLYILDQPQYAADEELMAFRDRIRHLLERCAFAAKGEQ